MLLPLSGHRGLEEQRNAMQSDTGASTDHAHHGAHVMPDGTVMDGAHHDHSHHVPAATPRKPSAKGEPHTVEYTCPMHPQVRQMGPGNCPICGMALEPLLASAETGESPELRNMTRRFWIGTALTIPVFALEMGGHLFDIHHFVSQQTSNWLQLLLATPVVLWAGWPFFARAAASIG